MSELFQVLVMMAVPAAYLASMRYLNVRADRAFDARMSLRGAKSQPAKNWPK